MTTTMTSAPSTSVATKIDPSASRGTLTDAFVRTNSNFAFIGRAGSGKTTAAQWLKDNYGYIPLSFAAALRDVAERIWGVSVYHDRDKLQRLGVGVREIDKDAWVNALMSVLEVSSALAPVVVDDCRFPNEYWALRERGFVFVRVEATEDLRIDRLMRKGKLQDRAQLNHVSETSLDDAYVDYTINNIVGPLAYQEEILDVLNKERRRL